MAEQPSPEPKVSRRKAKKQADARLQQWSTLRAPQAADAPVQPTLPPLVSSPPAALEPAQASLGVLIAATVLPVLTVLLLVATLSAGLPLLGGELHWQVLVAGGLVTGVCAYLTWMVASRPDRPRRALPIASGVALLLLVAFGAGLASQVVVEGKAQLTGSQGDRTYRIGQDALAVAAVLSENQKLLRLPSEQAKSLLQTFDDAIAQDTEIASLWNPATAQNLPTPAMADVYRVLNAAATRQSEALAAQKQNLLSPDTQLAAQAAAGYDAVASLLSQSGGPNSISGAVANAYHEAGLTRPTTGDKA